MKTIHDNLRMLNTLTAAIGNDIEHFLENPQDFDAAEYFIDVLTAANEAQHLVVQVRNQLKETTQ